MCPDALVRRNDHHGHLDLYKENFITRTQPNLENFGANDEVSLSPPEAPSFMHHDHFKKNPDQLFL